MVIIVTDLTLHPAFRGFFFRKLEVYEHEQMKHPKVIISNYLFIHYLKNIANINKIIYDLINVPLFMNELCVMKTLFIVSIF